MSRLPLARSDFRDLFWRRRLHRRAKKLSPFRAGAKLPRSEVHRLSVMAAVAKSAVQTKRIEDRAFFLHLFEPCHVFTAFSQKPKSDRIDGARTALRAARAKAADRRSSGRAC